MRKLLTLKSVPAWVEITWPEAHQIDEIRIHPGAPEMASKPSSECVPLDYRLQYQKGGEWVDLVPPVKGAMRYREHGFQTQDREFYSDYTFAPVSAKAIRMYITRTSDTGKRSESGDQVAVPEDKRETCLRLIEVLAAGRNAPASHSNRP